MTRSLVRTFIARRPGRACALLLAYTVVAALQRVHASTPEEVP